MVRWNFKRKKKTQNHKSGKADPVLFGAVIILMIFGLVMIASMGGPKSVQISVKNFENSVAKTTKEKIPYPTCDDQRIDCYLLMKNHAMRLVIGFILMLIVAKIPYQFWKKTAPVWFFLMIIVLFSVKIIGSTSGTTAKSWLVFFNTSLQPIEFAKLGLIFYLASWMEKRKSDIATFQNGFLPFCVIAGLLILPIILQPDFGGALVVAAVAVSIYFVGGARLRHLLIGGLIMLMAASILISSLPKQKERFDAFITEITDTSDASNCKENSCWQVKQSKIAIGSGGLFGKGLTQGIQKSYWLPQATDDFIFAASAEELGFLRISLVIILYGVIAYRGYRIARGAPNTFASLTAIGITAWIVFQAFVNLAVNLALMPVTGITLPFISYGGSSLLSVLIAIGILLHISKYSDYASHSSWRRNRRPYYSQYSVSREA